VNKKISLVLVVLIFSSQIVCFAGDEQDRRVAAAGHNFGEGRGDFGPAPAVSPGGKSGKHSWTRTPENAIALEPVVREKMVPPVAKKLAVGSAAIGTVGWGFSVAGVLQSAPALFGLGLGLWSVAAVLATPYLSSDPRLANSPFKHFAAPTLLLASAIAAFQGISMMGGPSVLGSLALPGGVPLFFGAAAFVGICALASFLVSKLA